EGIRYRNVTGVQTCALPILQEVKDYQSKTYVIALDKDTSGAKARAELEQKLLDLKCRVKHLYPEGEGVKDINDMLLKDEKSLLRSEERRVGKEERNMWTNVE